jgi:hypothetical protein
MKRHAIAALILSLVPLASLAHKPSDSYLQMRFDGTRFEGRWDIALRDLDDAIGLDVDGDGAITWGEVRARQSEIRQLASSSLSVLGDAMPCALEIRGLQIVAHSDGNYSALPLRVTCDASTQRIEIRYQLLFELDALHRGLLQLDWDGARGGIFAPDRRSLTFEAGETSSWQTAAQYFEEGVLHVWGGADHMLFLAGLFLPAVLRRRRRGGWHVEANLRPVVGECVRIVTAFTIAHALTLTLAASDAVSLPSRLVESLVALTVAFVGLNILWPMAHRALFWLAWIFGLVHGAAIASVLADVGLPAQGRVAALLSFNVGVEIAQLALVAIVIPLAFRARHSVIYRNGVMVPGAILVTLAGIAWFGERALNLELLPF